MFFKHLVITIVTILEFQLSKGPRQGPAAPRSPSLMCVHCCSGDVIDYAYRIYARQDYSKAEWVTAPGAPDPQGPAGSGFIVR